LRQETSCDQFCYFINIDGWNKKIWKKNIQTWRLWLRKNQSYTTMFKYHINLEMSKKFKKSRKLRKQKKNNWKNQTMKKTQLTWLKIWKNRPVRLGFDFIRLKLKKLNRAEPKPEKKLEKNRVKPKNRAKSENSVGLN
jgi:hypothetical protein